MGIKVLQIVGYQNSGKTTLVTKLIKKLQNEGLKVGSIKHHGHGGPPNLGDNGKDTEQHRLAGASVVAVEGKGTVQITAKVPEWNLNTMLALYEAFKLDVVIVEGYKYEKYPKVVLLTGDQDRKLLEEMENVIAVISTNSLTGINYPYFTRNEESAYLSFIMYAVRGN